MRFFVAEEHFLDFVQEKIWKNHVYSWNFTKHYFIQFSRASITFFKLSRQNRLKIRSITRQSLYRKSGHGFLFVWVLDWSVKSSINEV